MAHIKTESRYGFFQKIYKMKDFEIKSIQKDTELIDFMRNHFKVSYAKSFIDYSELPLNIWSSILPISIRTLQRELGQSKKTFDKKISEPMIEVGELYSLGLQAFEEDKDRFNEWLYTKNNYFDGRKPIEIMDTHKGRELIKSELMRIEYSEFS